MDLRTAALGLAALAAGYLVGRRLSLAGGASAGSLRERAGEALPGDGVTVPIGGADEGAGADDEPASGVDPSLEEVSYRTPEDTEEEPAEMGETEADEPLDERTGADVEEEPAEPGEMQVDEDVVDEAMDDETEE